MKRKILIIIILLAMFMEYRFIMYSIKPYLGNGGAVYLEVFGHIDEYYAEPMENLK